jgi:hypothetical protein
VDAEVQGAARGLGRREREDAGHCQGAPLSGEFAYAMQTRAQDYKEYHTE